MLLGLFSFLYFWVCVLIILLVLIQKAKGSLGMQGGAQAQAIFGSTGQDAFQKATWILGVIFMLGSLGLAKYRTHLASKSEYVDANVVLKGKIGEQSIDKSMINKNNTTSTTNND
jgi:protein translocase SecG subunit